MYTKREKEKAFNLIKLLRLNPISINEILFPFNSMHYQWTCRKIVSGYYYVSLIDYSVKVVFLYSFSTVEK